jgi:uncharacterized protein (DUF1499 family)
MARRYIAEEPTTQLAVWARRTALFALAATILAIIMVRSGMLEIRPALATFFGALAIAVVGLLIAFAAFVVIWKDGLGGMGSAISAIGVSLALVAYPAYIGARSYKLPWIYDITTDPIDPPRYDAKARPREANPIIYAGLATAELQRTAYPDIEPLEEDASPEAAYKAALDVITRRKWIVVLRRAPEPRRREGQIEAVARSPIMGFRDDVVVRVRGDGDGSRIDVRSSSRYGTFDFGSNAARIRALIDDIDDAIGNQKPDLPVVTPPKKGKAQPKAPPTSNQPTAKR